MDSVINDSDNSDKEYSHLNLGEAINNKMQRIIHFLENAKPEPIPDLELFAMSGVLRSPKELIYYRPSSEELGVVQLPLDEGPFVEITKARRYCRAALRTKKFQILCTDKEPLQEFTLLGQEIDLKLDLFKDVLETAKNESPYGYEIDYSSLFEYIAFSENYIYLGTGYFGPLFRALLSEFVSGKATYEKIAECNYFEDLSVEGDLISFAGERDVFVLKDAELSVWKQEHTVYRLFRVVEGNTAKFAAVTENTIEIRSLNIGSLRWGDTFKIPCTGFLQSFSFLHDGLLVVEEGIGKLVVVDIHDGNVQKCHSPCFEGIQKREHFNQVLFDEVHGFVYLLLREGTYSTRLQATK